MDGGAVADGGDDIDDDGSTDEVEGSGVDSSDDDDDEDELGFLGANAPVREPSFDAPVRLSSHEQTSSMRAPSFSAPPPPAPE